MENNRSAERIQTKRTANALSPELLKSWMDKLKQDSKPKPMYTPKSVTPVARLRYDCTVWLSGGQAFPANMLEIIRRTASLWVADGLTLGEHRVDGDKAQILFSARHDVAPVVFAARIKGRLQHALRQSGTPVKFSRKVAFRCLGENTSEVVTGYLRKQVSKEGFVDPRFEKHMEEYTVVRNDIDLSEPTATVRGRYWYNLHLVLVVDGRVQFKITEPLAKLRDGCLRIARQKGYRLKSVAVMLSIFIFHLGDCLIILRKTLR